MKYQAKHILMLRSETIVRLDNLLDVLRVSPGNDMVMIQAADIRMAVDDFKVILTEIRRLK